jgi:dienelactone hydrolase
VPALRAAGRTAVFFLKVLPMLPSTPVNWVTPEPVVERVRYPRPDGGGEGDLYRPATGGPHPGVVVCLGVVPFEVDHPQVPRLGEALARAGFAALLYWSPAMRDLRLDPDDTQGIALAYRWLIEQPDIDAARSGLLGTCVGGSFALMAAADATIRDRVGFVVAWAPFSSLRTLARDIATASTGEEGAGRPWDVDQLTRKVYLRSMTAMLDADEADALRAVYAAPDGRIDLESISADARAVAPLLSRLDAAQAERALRNLPDRMRYRLAAMSPIDVMCDIQAPVIMLAHDVDDAVIPVSESRRLHAVLGDRPGFRYTEFTMFKHLDPSKVDLPKLALLSELARFIRSVYPLFRASVS